MSKYFAAFAWKNASLNDFIHFLDEEFKKSNQGFTLEEWK
jgi:aminopeptidase N